MRTVELGADRSSRSFRKLEETVGKNGRTGQAFEKQMKSAQATMTTNKKAVDKLTTGMYNYSHEIDTSTKQGKLWSQSFTKNADNIGSSYKTLQSKQQTYLTTLKDQNSTQEQVTQSQKQADLAMQNYRGAVDQANRAQERYNQGLNVADSRFQRLRNGASKCFSGMNTAANAMIGGLTMIIGLVEQASSSYAAWGLNVTKMMAVTGQSSTSASSMLGAAQLLGIDPGVMITAMRYAEKNIGTALFNLGKTQAKDSIANQKVAVHAQQKAQLLALSHITQQMALDKLRNTQESKAQLARLTLQKLTITQQMANDKESLALATSAGTSLSGHIYKITSGLNVRQMGRYNAAMAKGAGDASTSVAAKDQKIMQTYSIAQIARNFGLTSAQAKLASSAALGDITWQQALEKSSIASQKSSIDLATQAKLNALAKQQQALNLPPDVALLVNNGLLSANQKIPTTSAGKQDLVKTIMNNLINLMPTLGASDRMRLMQKFFGRGAQQAVRYFMASSTQRQQLEQEAKDAGVVLNSSTYKGWQNYYGKMQQMALDWKGIQLGIMNALEPLLLKILPMFNKLLILFKDHLGIITKVVAAMAIFVGFAKGIYLLQKAVEGVQFAWTALMGAGEGTGIVGFVGTMLGAIGPAGWVIIGLGIVTAAVVTLYLKWKKFHDLVNSVFGLFKNPKNVKPVVVKYVGDTKRLPNLDSPKVVKVQFESNQKDQASILKTGVLHIAPQDLQALVYGLGGGAAMKRFYQVAPPPTASEAAFLKKAGLNALVPHAATPSLTRARREAAAAQGYGMPYPQLTTHEGAGRFSTPGTPKALFSQGNLSVLEQNIALGMSTSDILKDSGFSSLQKKFVADLIYAGKTGSVALVKTLEKYLTPGLRKSFNAELFVEEFTHSIANNIVSSKGGRVLYEDLVRTGKNWMLGLILGMHSKNKQVQATAEAIAAGINTHAAHALDARSPSKKGIELGQNYVKGVVIGLSGDKKTKSAIITYADDFMNDFTTEMTFQTTGAQGELNCHLFMDPFVVSLKKVLGIHSPSSVALKLGLNFGSAFISGIDKALTGGTKKTATALQSLLSAISSASGGGGGLGGSGIGGLSGPSNPTGNVALGKKMAAAAGWTGGQWGALYRLWSNESGWRNTAQNPNSSAYGIAQFMDSTWSGYGPKTSNPGLQIKYGLEYIKGRYGTPEKALNFWENIAPTESTSHSHWYDQGGKLPPGLSLAYNGTGHDEIHTNGYAGGDIYVTVNINGTMLTSETALKKLSKDIGIRIGKEALAKIRRQG